jgi:hypothetical protein
MNGDPPDVSVQSLARAALAAGLLIAGACAGTDRLEGFALYDAGRAVALDRQRAAGLRTQARALFSRCHTTQDVTGRPPDQAGLRQLWNDWPRATYALLEDRGADSVAVTVLLALDPDHGVDVVLADREGVVTSYSKCPGVEAMALGCALSRQLPSAAPWPVCGAVERLRGQLGS